MLKSIFIVFYVKGFLDLVVAKFLQSTRMVSDDDDDV